MGLVRGERGGREERGVDRLRCLRSRSAAAKEPGLSLRKQGAGTCVLTGKAAPGQGTLPKKQKPVAFYHEWKGNHSPSDSAYAEERFQE